VDTKILIVTDDPEMQSQLVQALSGRGFWSFAVPRGGSTIFQLGLIQPDLVILDVGLDGMDRWRTLHHVREVSSVPVIVLVAPQDREGRSESLDRGADSCLSKPFEAQELQARVRALVRRVHYAARSTRQSQTVCNQPVTGFSLP
jgi:DNA-binding response OmpR family regulator